MTQGRATILFYFFLPMKLILLFVRGTTQPVGIMSFCSSRESLLELKMEMCGLKKVGFCKTGVVY